MFNYIHDVKVTNANLNLKNHIIFHYLIIFNSYEIFA
jgi:hypothetical protein